MIEYILQNFNWPTFFMALGVFALLSSLVNVITSQIRYKKAMRKLAESDQQYEALKKQLKVLDQEYDKVMGKKEAR